MRIGNIRGFSHKLIGPTPDADKFEISLGTFVFVCRPRLRSTMVFRALNGNAVNDF